MFDILHDIVEKLWSSAKVVSYYIVRKIPRSEIAGVQHVYTLDLMVNSSTLLLLSLHLRYATHSYRDGFIFLYSGTP